MKAACPIVFKQMNDVVARIIAAMVVGIALTGLITHSILPALFLIVDFFFRGVMQKTSPLEYIAIVVQKTFNLGKDVNAGPKIFAAKLGLVAAVAISIFAYFEIWLMFTVASSILSSFAFLEAAFDYCVGCKAYPYWQVATARFRS